MQAVSRRVIQPEPVGLHCFLSRAHGCTHGCAYPGSDARADAGAVTSAVLARSLGASAGTSAGARASTGTGAGAGAGTGAGAEQIWRRRRFSRRGGCDRGRRVWRAACRRAACLRLPPPRARVVRPRPRPRPRPHSDGAGSRCQFPIQSFTRRRWSSRWRRRRRDAPCTGAGSRASRGGRGEHESLPAVGPGAVH